MARVVVETLRGGVVVVVAEVGTDHDQRLRTAPDRLEHGGDRIGVGVADHQRHQRETGQDLLEERQVHLETVL